MILYGARRTYHGQKVIEEMQCEKCDSTTYVLINQYLAAHIFYIPFLAVSCNTLAICPSCKKRYTLKKFNNKYNLGLTKEDQSTIKDQLHDQLTDEEKKKYKRRSAIGYTVACIALGLFVIILVSSAIG